MTHGVLSAPGTSLEMRLLTDSVWVNARFVSVAGKWTASTQKECRAPQSR